jgi:peptidoglycan/xylan/chitin deacetylase (PgdA/CDA1 family)
LANDVFLSRQQYFAGRCSCENSRVNPWIITAPAVVAAAAGLTAYGAVYPRAQLFGPTTRHTSSPRKLSITFDDGPNPAMTPRLLDILDRYNARATFFLIGRYAQECPNLVREIAARRHLIGNHTQTHPNLFLLGPTQIREELRRCQDAISTTLNATPKWFRPPWGFRSPWLASITRELDLRTVMWTLIPSDWCAPSPEWLIDRMNPIALRATSAARSWGHARNGDVLCLHDGGHRGQGADRTHTLAALEYWLPRWRDVGLEFATIEEAVRTPAS